MASPTYQSAANTSVNSFTDPWTVNLPASIASGDLLLMVVNYEGDTAVTVNTPSGWTLLKAITTAEGADEVNFRLFGRVADGNESSTLSLDFSGSVEGCARVLRMSDWYGELTNVSGDDWTGLYFTTVEGRPNPFEPDPPSATAPWGAADNLAVAGFASQADNDAGIDSGPSGYSNAGAATYNESSGDLGMIGTATKTTTSATEDPGTFTITTPSGVDTVVAFTVMVRPVSAATGPLLESNLLRSPLLHSRLIR